MRDDTGFFAATTGIIIGLLVFNLVALHELHQDNLRLQDQLQQLQLQLRVINSHNINWDKGETA